MHGPTHFRYRLAFRHDHAFRWLRHEARDSANGAGAARGREGSYYANFALDYGKTYRPTLVERGIPAGQLIAEGVGANDPVVPDSDYADRWKNGRVEFYLVKWGGAGRYRKDAFGTASGCATEVIFRQVNERASPVRQVS